MKKCIPFITIFAVLVIINASYSYTPSSYHLIKNVLKQFRFDEPLIIEQDVFRAPVDGEIAEAEENELFSNSKTYIKYPSSLYIKWTLDVTMDDDTVKVNDIMEYIVKDEKVTGKIGEDMLTYDRNDFMYFYELFAYDDIEPVLKYLDSINIDTKKITLGMYDHKVCYVIGCDNLNDRANQLWIEKDAMLPKLILIRYNTSEGEGSFKFEFADYSLDDKLFFPKKIKYFSNDILTSELVTTTINRAIIENDDIFNADNIKVTPPPEAPLFMYDEDASDEPESDPPE